MTKKKKEYWEEVDELYDEVYGKAKEEIKKEYERLFDELEPMMLGMLLDYQQKQLEGRLTNNTIYSFNKYYKLLDTIQIKLKKLGDKEERIIATSLTEMYEKTSKLVGETIGFNQPITDLQVQQAISTPWCEGKRFSDRIWSNKGKLVEVMRKGLADIALTGAKRDKVTKELMKMFNVGYNQADRLVRTELNYQNNKAALDTMVKAGIKKFRVLTAQDDRVCKECEEISKKVFNIEEATVGVNVPPFHPNERCTIVAVRE